MIFDYLNNIRLFKHWCEVATDLYVFIITSESCKIIYDNNAAIEVFKQFIMSIDNVWYDSTMDTLIRL